MPYHFITNSSETIKLLTNPIDLWVNISLAIITFLAVLVALFQDKIRKFFNTAHLKIELDLEWPNSHMIDLTQNGRKISDSFYMRMKVSNIKGPAAENVEIMPIKFVKVEDGAENPVVNFLPISFVWSHFQPRINTVRIPPKFFRHCDLGHFIPNPGNDEMRLFLDTLVIPNRVSSGEYGNIFNPGKYRLEVLLTGDNVKPLKKEWEIEFSKWDDNEEMLRRMIKLIEI